jgi:FdhE protein
MTRDAWLAAHPYLRDLANLQSLVDRTAAEVSIPNAAVPAWNDYSDDFCAGVPLLLNSRVTIDLRRMESEFASFVKNLATKQLPGELTEKTHDIVNEFQRDLSAPRQALSWIAHKTPGPIHPDLIYYLGWTLLARYLRPVTLAFDERPEQEHWLRNYCPICGAPPAMSQLVGSDPARIRFLWCSHCATRWHYRRAKCPFCETEDDHRLAVLAIEREDALRIDYCELCGGYIKTCLGGGSESVLLKDWASLHLDIIARDHGLTRCAASLWRL